MRLLEKKTVYSGWSDFLLLQVQLADGRVVQRQLEDHGDAAAVLPYDPERRVAMVVRQARLAPLFEGQPPRLVEAAAGLIDPGEEPDEAARREAMEELGLELAVLEPVAAVWTSPSVSSERLHLYLAPYRLEDRVADGGGRPEEGEDIEVLEPPLKELLRQSRSGEVADMKTLTLIWALALQRPELFA